MVVDGFGTIDTGVSSRSLFTGIGCSAVAFSLSAWAQRTIDAVPGQHPQPARAGGRRDRRATPSGERLGVAGYLGAALILAGIFVAERGTHDGRRPSPARRLLDRSVKSGEECADG